MVETGVESSRKRQRGGQHWNEEKEKTLINTALGSEPIASKSCITSAMVAITWGPAWIARASQNVGDVELREQVAMWFGVSEENVHVRERKFLLTVEYTFEDDHEVFGRLRVQDWKLKVSRFCEVEPGVDFRSLRVSVAKGKVVFTVKVGGQYIGNVANTFMDAETAFTWPTSSDTVSFTLQCKCDTELLVECMLEHEQKMINFVEETASEETASTESFSCLTPRMKLRILSCAAPVSCTGRMPVTAWGGERFVCQSCLTGAMAVWAWPAHAATVRHCQTV